MAKTTISDARIKLHPTNEILKLIAENLKPDTETPKNIFKILENSGYDVTSRIESLATDHISKLSKIDTHLLKELLSNKRKKSDKTHSTVIKNKKTDSQSKIEEKSEIYLHLSDFIWLCDFLTQLRKDKQHDHYIHEFIQNCELKLPENDLIERNAELEARCQKLREEQQNREYRQMTKNVDAAIKNFPDDSLAYQMKSLNSQIIAVFQFVVSVVAGFVFGFLGLELIIGNLEFGFRLLLGIMCALIIALAEIYFLAKKLNEYDDVVDKSALKTSAPKKKLHYN